MKRNLRHNDGLAVQPYRSGSGRGQGSRARTKRLVGTYSVSERGYAK